MEKVGIIGSAIVGQTLARGFKQHGYDVRIASRTPAKLAAFSSSSGITAGTFDDVAAWSDVGVLAVHGVIDTSNPISDAPPVDGVIQYFTGPNDSLLERLQHAFPEVRLVKAFNSVGSARMVDPAFKGGRPTMFFCANDADAKAWVAKLLDAFGWEAADMGSAVAARAIEPLAQLWCIPGFRQNHWTHAFHVLWS